MKQKTSFKNNSLSLLDQIAFKLLECPIVMATKGVNLSLGPQLIADIGKMTHLSHRGAIVAFSGIGFLQTTSGITSNELSVQ